MNKIKCYGHDKYSFSVNQFLNIVHIKIIFKVFNLGNMIKRVLSLKIVYMYYCFLDLFISKFKNKRKLLNNEINLSLKL